MTTYHTKICTICAISDNLIISQLASLSINSVRSVTGKNVSNITNEFGLDHVTVNKRKFSVSKRCIPDYGFENLELLDYLLYLRSNETEDEIKDELNELIIDICSN